LAIGDGTGFISCQVVWTTVLRSGPEGAGWQPPPGRPSVALAGARRARRGGYGTVAIG